jgi:capsid protein
MSNGELFVGASDHRLFADWSLRINEPNHVWSREWMALAARAVSLVCNDPFAAAMVNAKIRETHGPRGLSLRSAYSENSKTRASDAERQRRRDIEGLIFRASAGTSLDAKGELTWLEFDRQMDWIATVMGDAWAVYLWKPGRPGNPLLNGCWRIITPERVCNPEWASDTTRLQRGCELDADGALVAIWVMTGEVGDFGIIDNPVWKRIPIYNAAGMRQVMHRVGTKVPGMMRGVSMFAPALLLLRQIQGTVEAHVAGKRAQAIHPIIYFTEDEEELKAAVQSKAMLGPNAALGPMSILVAKYGATDVKFMDSKFQGSDLRDFLTTMYRSLTAMWGLPWQVVLCEMGEASLASARAGLDQNERTCETYGGDHTAQVSSIRNEAIVREGKASRIIDLGTDDYTIIMQGRYTRPPRYSTDRKKDAETVTALIKAKVSPTTAHELVLGLNYEDECEQTARDIETAKAQGLPDPTIEANGGGFQQASDPGQTPTPTDPETGDPPATEDQQTEEEQSAAAVAPITIHMPPATRQAASYRIIRDAAGRPERVAVEEITP